MTSQIDRADRFRSLHVPYDPIILYNIWDAGSAKAIVRAGAKAVATSSWSMAAAQGYEDGEQLPLDDALELVGRIVQSVDCPVTVDFEGGYSADPDGVNRNVRRLLELGVIGLNFEDQLMNAPGLYGIDDQVERLRAVRAAADALGVPAFINARTDVFLNAAPDGDHTSLVEEVLARAQAYAEAGADGFFVPGLTDNTLIRIICEAATLPVNVMVAESNGDLPSLGVSRISFGPNPYVRLTAVLEREAGAMCDRHP
jgi:2-methylisocitrate lyase-like PEP mutase family enzyme